jgi:hypothetical protein
MRMFPTLEDIRSWFDRFKAAEVRREADLQRKNEVIAQRTEANESLRTSQKESAAELAASVKGLCKESRPLEKEQPQKELTGAILIPLLEARNTAVEFRSELAELRVKQSRLQSEYDIARTKELKRLIIGLIVAFFLILMLFILSKN